MTGILAQAGLHPLKTEPACYIGSGIRIASHVDLFVCHHIVFSHVVAMTNYLLPSPPMQNTSLMGRIL
jgi:hypothetical protein